MGNKTLTERGSVTISYAGYNHVIPSNDLNQINQIITHVEMIIRDTQKF